MRSVCDELETLIVIKKFIELETTHKIKNNTKKFVMCLKIN
jgi:hypothetical protein